MKKLVLCIAALVAGAIARGQASINITINADSTLTATFGGSLVNPSSAVFSQASEGYLVVSLATAAVSTSVGAQTIVSQSFAVNGTPIALADNANVVGTTGVEFREPYSAGSLPNRLAFFFGANSLHAADAVTGSIRFSNTAGLDLADFTGANLYWGYADVGGDYNLGPLQQAASVTAVPEPSTYALAIGFICIGAVFGVRRFRRRPQV